MKTTLQILNPFARSLAFGELLIYEGKLSWDYRRMIIYGQKSGWGQPGRSLRGRTGHSLRSSQLLRQGKQKKMSGEWSLREPRTLRNTFLIADASSDSERDILPRNVTIYVRIKHQELSQFKGNYVAFV